VNSYFSKQALVTLLQRHQTSDMYVADRFPPQKLQNAVAYFPIPRQSVIVGLIDCTVFGSCKVGLAITLEGFIWKNDWATESRQTSLTWDQLLQYERTLRAVNTDIEFCPGIRFGMAGSSMEPAAFIQLCFAIIDLLSRQSASQHNHDEDMQPDERYLIFVGAFAVLIAKFAKIDGPITQNEIEYIEETFDELSEGDPSTKSMLIDVFNKSKDEPVDIREVIKHLTLNIPCSDPEKTQDILLSMYITYWELAMVDGKLSTIKHALLQELPNMLGLPISVYHEASREFLGTPGSQNETPSRESQKTSDMYANYFALLGCNPNCTDDELRMAYRRKVSSLHPDKLQSKELANELLQFANEQVQKINHAYAEIVKHRNR
jgi:DnaJ like chaperone protein